MRKSVASGGPLEKLGLPKGAGRDALVAVVARSRLLEPDAVLTRSAVDG